MCVVVGRNLPALVEQHAAEGQYVVVHALLDEVDGVAVAVTSAEQPKKELLASTDALYPSAGVA